jgi:hypothetical protein
MRSNRSFAPLIRSGLGGQTAWAGTPRWRKDGTVARKSTSYSRSKTHTRVVTSDRRRVARNRTRGPITHASSSSASKQMTVGAPVSRGYRCRAGRRARPNLSSWHFYLSFAYEFVFRNAACRTTARPRVPKLGKRLSRQTVPLQRLFRARFFDENLWVGASADLVPE